MKYYFLIITSFLLCYNTQSVCQQVYDCELYNLAVENFISKDIGVSSKQGLSYKYHFEKNNIYINSSLIYKDSLHPSFLNGLFYTKNEKKWIKKIKKKKIILNNFYSLSYNNEFVCDGNKFNEDTLNRSQHSSKNILCNPQNALISFSNPLYDNNGNVLLYGLWKTYNNNKVFVFYVFRKKNNDWETVAYKYLAK